MKTIVKIKSISLTKLNNAEYTNFSSRFLTLVNETGSSEVPGSTIAVEAEVLEQYDADLLTMHEIVAQSRTSDLTAVLAGLDKERDELVSFLINTIRNAKSSPLAAQRTAGTSLYNVVKPYIGCQRLANQQETAKIIGLIADLSKEANMANATILHLDEVIAGLNEKNTEYATLTDQRTNEKAAAQLDESKNVRLRMDEKYDYITNVAFAQSVVQPAEPIALFISRLNTLIDEVNALYNQRLAQIKKTE